MAGSTTRSLGISLWRLGACFSAAERALDARLDHPHSPRRQRFIRRSSWLLYYHIANVDTMLIEHNGGGNDQVDCCCWFCFSCRDIGASNDTRADSSAR